MLRIALVIALVSFKIISFWTGTMYNEGNRTILEPDNNIKLSCEKFKYHEGKMLEFNKVTLQMEGCHDNSYVSTLVKVVTYNNKNVDKHSFTFEGDFTVLNMLRNVSNTYRNSQSLSKDYVDSVNAECMLVGNTKYLHELVIKWRIADMNIKKSSSIDNKKRPKPDIKDELNNDKICELIMKKLLLI